MPQITRQNYEMYTAVSSDLSISHEDELVQSNANFATHDDSDDPSSSGCRKQAVVPTTAGTRSHRDLGNALTHNGITEDEVIVPFNRNRPSSERGPRFKSRAMPRDLTPRNTSSRDEEASPHDTGGLAQLKVRRRRPKSDRYRKGNRVLER